MRSEYDVVYHIILTWIYMNHGEIWDKKLTYPILNIVVFAKMFASIKPHIEMDIFLEHQTLFTQRMKNFE